MEMYMLPFSFLSNITDTQDKLFGSWGCTLPPDILPLILFIHYYFNLQNQFGIYLAYLNWEAYTSIKNLNSGVANE